MNNVRRKKLEYIQSGSRGDTAQNAIDSIENAVSSLEDAVSSVDESIT
jgi:hypothetical protein